MLWKRFSSDSELKTSRNQDSCMRSAANCSAVHIWLQEVQMQSRIPSTSTLLIIPSNYHFLPWESEHTWPEKEKEHTTEACEFSETVFQKCKIFKSRKEKIDTLTISHVKTDEVTITSFLQKTIIMSLISYQVKNAVCPNQDRDNPLNVKKQKKWTSEQAC